MKAGRARGRGVGELADAGADEKKTTDGKPALSAHPNNNKKKKRTRGAPQGCRNVPALDARHRPAATHGVWWVVAGFEWKGGAWVGGDEEEGRM